MQFPLWLRYYIGEILQRLITAALWCVERQSDNPDNMSSGYHLLVGTNNCLGALSLQTKRHHPVRGVSRARCGLVHRSVFEDTVLYSQRALFGAEELLFSNFACPSVSYQ